MIGGAERQVVTQAVFARGPAQRPLGGDMQLGRCLWQGIEHRRQPAIGKQRQPDFRIGWCGDGAEPGRVDNQTFMPAFLKLLHRAFDGPNDTVDLGVPGICDDDHAQGKGAGGSG